MAARRFLRALVSSAPTRLDFGGGWTDVPPYPEERGGFVCNVAISRYATARVAQLAPDAASTAVDASRGEMAPALVLAAMRRFASEPVSVSLVGDFPASAGLGGSSACGVAVVAALRTLAEQECESPRARDEIAEASRGIEVEELGIAGGRQDHYAAAHGGALAITFDGRGTTAERIALSASATAALESRCLVGFTGESRLSGNNIAAVLADYHTRTPRVVDALARMKALALQMPPALASGDIDTLAALVDEHWVHQRSLHPAITTERIEALDRAVRAAGATGLKALGASGGGCVMVFAPDDRRRAVREAMRPLAEPIEWRVADAGVTVRESTGVLQTTRRP